MYYEPMRMQRWLSIHSLVPREFREKDEKLMMIKHPKLVIKVNGEMIDQNFKDL